jgi:tetratricopeptide (TPR) repeat protein
LQANLAIDRLRLGDRQNVEQDLLAALAIAQNNGQEFHATRCLEGLTECNLVLGNLEAALKYADALLKLAEPRKLNEMVAQVHRWRGEVMLAAGQLDAAEDELNQAAALATEIGRVRLRWDVHTALHRLYEIRGQAELAHKHETIVQTIVAQISENLQEVELRTGLPIG